VFGRRLARGRCARWLTMANDLRPLIAEKTAAQAFGEPCCDWVGESGSGHYVKMVHNGIEYGDMQLIAEAYDILTRGLGLSAGEIADIFEKVCVGRVASWSPRGC
jgi:6-phosphogluconate dehydrogenase